MHPSDQHPPTPGRPNLVNSDEELTANRPRLVSGLDFLDREPAAKWGLAKFPWALCGALVLAIGAATMLWSGDESGKQIIVAGTEPVISASPAVQETSPDELLDGDAAPPVMVKDLTPVADLAPPTVKRVDLKFAPSASMKHRAPSQKSTKKTAPKKVKAAGPKKKRAPVPKPEVKSEPDKDVALLAAMVMHTKAIAGPSEFVFKWKQCAEERSVAAAKTCRARLCSTYGAEAECRGSKATPARSKP